eukprot:TRINITY_DN70142_c0_g1_i1.p1 TRINITY_DN70142_c0_g1~~TRINITY_DN70142_c0_g1_i1.p1  ORF type:complete len:367 (+),score=21.73 TRINITY_DN70142_c0_g1_i1:94-1194(+)
MCSPTFASAVGPRPSHPAEKRLQRRRTRRSAPRSSSSVPDRAAAEGTPAAAPLPTPHSRFCTQCGTAAHPAGAFCHVCGTRHCLPPFVLAPAAAAPSDASLRRSGAARESQGQPQPPQGSRSRLQALRSSGSCGAFVPFQQCAASAVPSCGGAVSPPPTTTPPELISGAPTSPRSLPPPLSPSPPRARPEEPPQRSECFAPPDDVRLQPAMPAATIAVALDRVRSLLDDAELFRSVYAERGCTDVHVATWTPTACGRGSERRVTHTSQTALGPRRIHETQRLTADGDAVSLHISAQAAGGALMGVVFRAETLFDFRAASRDSTELSVFYRVHRPPGAAATPLSSPHAAASACAMAHALSEGVRRLA